MNTLGPKIGLKARCAIGPFGGLIGVTDFGGKNPNSLNPRRWLAVGPCVKAALGHPQNTAHHRNRIGGLVGAHELEPLGGITSVSRANQAAAFERISRSIRSCLFSRRKRLSSSRSPVAKPSGLTPSSRSACLTHVLIVSAFGSNSRERSCGVRPSTAAPRPRTPSEQRYSDRKLRSKS